MNPCPFPKQTKIHYPEEVIRAAIQLRTNILFTLRDEFRGRRRCRCTKVGGEIGDGVVDLMTDCRDHRNPGCSDGAGNRFFVECPEIFTRTAATTHDQHIDTRTGIRPIVVLARQRNRATDLERKSR